MCHVVRLYNDVFIVVMSGDVVCCNVVCDTLVGVCRCLSQCVLSC